MRVLFVVFFFLLSLEANSKLGDIEYSKQNYTKAIEYYKSVSSNDDPNIKIKLAQSYVRLADNYSRSRQYDKSIENYKKAIKLKSRVAKIKLSKVYEIQGDMFYSIKKYKKSLEYYSKANVYINKDVKPKIKKVKEILKHQKRLVDDTRKVVLKGSKSWTNSVGRLIIPTKLEFITKKRYKTKYKKCTATLVNINSTKKSKVIVTASHCLTSYDKEAGVIKFIIKDKNKNMTQRYATVVKNSNFNVKKLNSKSDYAILVLNDYIDQKSLSVDSRSFSSLYKEYKAVFASLAGFSSDVGNYGDVLTFDPKCDLKPSSKNYALSSCKAFKGASGGAVVMGVSNDGKNISYKYVGVISHFKNKNFKNIYFSPHHIFYKKLETIIKKYNN